MTKELTPLEALEEIRNDSKHRFLQWYQDFINERLSIIETALKDYNRMLSLGIKASINEIYPKSILSAKDLDKIKALEIIKEKKVNVRAFLKCCHREDGLTIYNNQCDNNSVMESKELTQEEYDLLKEVLL